MGGTEILLNIASAVALLLWGVRMVRTGLTRAFGASLHRTLAACTKNRLAAFAGGLGVTTILQSSTATALIVSSFTARNVLTPTAALAAMLGADVGTSLVAQFLSFDLRWLSPLLVLVGVIAFMTAEAGQRRHLGRAAIGLGLMLLALKFIITASTPLRESAALAAIVDPLAAEPLLAALLAALLTWLAHSSLAVVLLTISLASGGVIPLALAFPLILGANVGSGIAPMIMTLSSQEAARAVPLGNLLMRLLGALLLLPFLDAVTPHLALLEAAPTRQIANFHTAFNLALAIVFLPFVSFVGAGCARLLPSRAKAHAQGKPRYLDPDVLDTPPLALACAARETLRMGDEVEQMLRQSIEVFRDDDAKLLRKVEERDDTVDALHEAIKLYLTRVSREELDRSESRRYVEVLTFNTNLEHIGDVIDKNLMELAAKKIKNRFVFSPDGWSEICAFHDRVLSTMQLALNVFMSGDVKSARQLLRQKDAIRTAEREAAESHLNRLHAGLPESIETSSLHLDIIRDLKRIHGHLTSVAYPILEAAGELRTSRLGPPSASEDEEGVDGIASPDGSHVS